MPEVSPTLTVTPKKQAAAPQIIVETLKSFIFAILLCSVIYIFFFTPNQVEGYSMYPAFHDGELVVTNKMSEWLGSTVVGKSLGLDYARGDVVVISKPGFGKPIIKRIIGLAGEQIQVSKGKVLVNGVIDSESYIPDTILTIPGTFIDGNNPKTVPDGQFAVMGDNRENSLDSRYTEIGFIERGWIEGKVIFRYWPLDRFGSITTGKSSLN